MAAIASKQSKPPLGVAMIARATAAAILLAAATGTPALAEELYVTGMGRLIGWIIATSPKTLGFQSCVNQLLPLGMGKIEKTRKKCVGLEKMTFEGKVVTVDLEQRVITARDAAGEEIFFHVGQKTMPAEALAALKPNTMISATGPILRRANSLVVHGEN